MAMPRGDMARDVEAEMKSYARRNKRELLKVKYRHRGMAKTNYRKLGKRIRFRKIDE